MNVFENQALLRAILIAASGVVVGLMLSLGRGLVRLIWKYKREAADVPLEELLPALAMAFTPITKVFYALVAIAAITSAMSVLGAIIGSFIDIGINKGKGNQRNKLAWGFGIATTIIGVLVACDGLGSYFPPMFGKFCWVDGFDLISEGILMPIGAFLTTIFFGWIDRDVLPNEVRIGSDFKTEKFYRFCIRWVAPLFTLLVLLGQLDTFFGFGWFQ